ncbi:helix-turn-helix transcriptional regulator [Psychromonas sp. Urea-02u-13]|uniref:helix-turn-helix transcriptional regulator n=1 Tax=Psychromonas sp. Urea-02u-13 TaxID=2058326 RepID=UPI000C323271|nr:helix-turn-helix transcriptional regulator [Psychromonas sp. Urea-02u-13]PKG39715.1 transcriptional regulator [Psychromonas sp. Urea-02u-13]
MNLGKKIKSIRICERLNQVDFSQLIDLPIGTLQGYEQEKRHPTSEGLLKITTHEQLKKYTLWLMTGDTALESGQVCPDFSILLSCGLIEDETEKRA